MSLSITRPLLPEVVAGPTAELHVAGEFSDVADIGECAAGLAVNPFGRNVSGFDGVLFPLTSELIFRIPFVIEGDKPFAGEDPCVGVPNGWKPFIVVSGSSSIRKLALRKFDAA